MAETNDEMNARHRKELKALEGEKRAAIKKAKSTSGKKSKSLIAELEIQYDEKSKQMKARHTLELHGHCKASDASPEQNVASDKGGADEINNKLIPEDEEKQRKIEKARRKRAKQREKEQRREDEIAEANAHAGPSARDVENAIIQQQLNPLGMEISEVAADGHCLYRAVAAQTGTTYLEMREKCASTLQLRADDFSPFCEYTDAAPDFSAYIEQVRSSAEWGGHLELRALSIALNRPVLIYSTQSLEPLSIAESGGDSDEDPIRLSYHLRYYALGEHYNQVVPKSN